MKGSHESGHRNHQIQEEPALLQVRPRAEGPRPNDSRRRNLGAERHECPGLALHRPGSPDAHRSPRRVIRESLRSSSIERLRQQAARPDADFFYGAPVVIIASGESDSPTVAPDCAAGLEKSASALQQHQQVASDSGTLSPSFSLTSFSRLRGGSLRHAQPSHLQANEPNRLELWHRRRRECPPVPDATAATLSNGRFIVRPAPDLRTRRPRPLWRNHLEKSLNKSLLPLPLVPLNVQRVQHTPLVPVLLLLLL